MYTVECNEPGCTYKFEWLSFKDADLDVQHHAIVSGHRNISLYGTGS